MSNSKKLVLFDVDGTLMQLHGGAGHAKQFNRAFLEVCGKRVDIRNFSIPGSTDKAITTKILQHLGFNARQIEEFVPKVIEAETRIFLRELKQEKRKAFPGVKELLLALSKKNCRLGLVTGNPEKIAFGKLESAGIRRFFSLGGFGSAVIQRRELVGMALREAKEKFREEYEGKQIVVVGDTAKDIESAKPFNAKAIAVLTGSRPEEETRSSSPDFVFNDLTDTEKVMEAIFSD